jgi:hypothetical protein
VGGFQASDNGQRAEACGRAIPGGQILRGWRFVYDIRRLVLVRSRSHVGQFPLKS